MLTLWSRYSSGLSTAVLTCYRFEPDGNIKDLTVAGIKPLSHHHWSMLVQRIGFLKLLVHCFVIPNLATFEQATVEIHESASGRRRFSVVSVQVRDFENDFRQTTPSGWSGQGSTSSAFVAMHRRACPR